MKTFLLKTVFFCLLIIFTHCKSDFNEFDSNRVSDQCQETQIELDFQSRLHRSSLSNYVWKDWTDGLDIDWTNDGKTLIFSFQPNLLCYHIAILGAETQTICPTLNTDLNLIDQSFTFHLSPCLMEQSSIFLSISHY